MTVSPAYGRNPKSKKEIQALLEQGRDFVVRDAFSGARPGSYCNLQDLQNAGITEITVRYAQDRKVTIVKVPKKAQTYAEEISARVLSSR